MSKKIMKVFEEYCKMNNITGKEKEKKLKKMKEIIKKYIYEPCEAIGIIAAQSISEPATQMSLDYNEKVIVKKDDVIKIVKIGDFIDSIVNLLGFQAEGWDVYDMSRDDIFVPSITESEGIEWKKIKACSRHEAPETLIKIKTRSGREITATDSHSFVVRKNNSITPTTGSDLNLGDRIPVMRYLPENCIGSIETKSLFSGNGQMLINAKKPLPETLELNEDLGWIFGAYLAEGNCTRNYVSFSNVDDNFLSKIRRFAETYGFTYNEYDNFRGFAKGHDIRVNSTLLSYLMKITCGTGSRNKIVPQFAYSAKERFVAGLIGGYFDCDGNVSETRGVIRVSSSSKELIDGISLLLARFGIFATKNHKKEVMLTISQKYANIFREKIGFTIKKKLGKLGKICKYKNKQDFIDMFSGFGMLFYNTAKKLDYPTRYVNNFTKRQKIGRSTIIKYADLFERISKRKGIDVSKNISIMRQMASSDVIWDEIIKIATIAPNSKYVYDFTVEGTETFTTFDGIVTHNTMRSYTLVSQSDRLSKVTQGLPRLIEIFDLRKTFEKNMLIYLKPEYNLKEKAKEIANKIKSRKVADIIKSDSIDLVELRIELELEREGDKEKIKKIVDKYLKDTDISLRGDKVFIKPKKDDVKNLRKIRNKLLKFHIDGIKDIENVVVIREENDWVIQTTGTNLKKVFDLPEVDLERTRTNDIHQIYEILGVEAARNVIFQEAKETLDEQGLDVDIRHLLLLADTMTFDGDIKAIGRYGISGKKASVLAKANFEETKKHLINASFYGETDTLDGVIENILLGQIAPIGTGMVELTIDMEKMRQILSKK